MVDFIHVGAIPKLKLWVGVKSISKISPELILNGRLDLMHIRVQTMHRRSVKSEFQN